MEYSNAQKLAAVVSEWARPAISQIASGNLMKLPILQSLQATIGSLGIVSGNYSLKGDLQPLVSPIIDALITPMLNRYISNIPDDNIPKMAHDLVEQARHKGSLSILEGVVTLEEEDIEELALLLEKNLPVCDSQGYQVIH